MSTSRPSLGLTPSLAARFTAAQERFLTSSGESSTSAATTPSGGTPDGVASSSSSLTAVGEANDIFERLARLATTEPPAGRPPLETYTTTPTEHGDVFRATPEFRDWLRSNYNRKILRCIDMQVTFQVNTRIYFLYIDLKIHMEI